jgi:hypothetical protein
MYYNDNRKDWNLVGLANGRGMSAWHILAFASLYNNDFTFACLRTK